MVVQAEERMASSKDDGYEVLTLAQDLEGTGVAEANTFFPDDVLGKIMSCVGNDGGIKSLSRCMEVCKQWKQVAESTVSTVVWSRANRTLRCAAGASRYENLHAITMDHCFAGRGGWSPVFEALGEACPHLESLSMLQVQPPLATSDLTLLFSNCCLLNRVQFVNALTPCATLPTHLMASLKHIQIELTQWAQFSEPLLLPTVDPLTRLTSLLLNNLPAELQLPPLSTITSLRHLSLAFCDHLLSFPPLSNLPMLEILDLDACEDIHVLPLDNLHQLHTLNVNGCCNLEMIRGIEALTLLRVLDLSVCHRLRDIAGIAAFGHIEKLGLDVDCERATWVLEWLPQLTGLRFLSLFVAESVAIHTLRLPCCLHHLEIHSIYLPVDAPATAYCAIVGPKDLQFLHVDMTIRLESAAYQSLRTISQMPWSNAPAPFVALDPFQDLQELSLSFPQCRMLGSQVTGAFPNNLPQTLTALELMGEVDVCPPLDALSGLCLLKLELTDLHDWPRHSLGQLLCLRYLVLEGCESLKEIPDLQSLALLEVLTIEGSAALRKLPPLGALRNLEELSVKELDSLCELPLLDGLMSLKRLNVEACNDLVEMPSLDGLTALSEICLRHCHGLLRLPPLSGLVQLQALDLYDCVLLKELPPLDGLSQLLWLDLRKCDGLRTGRPGAWAGRWQGAHESLVVFYPGQDGGVSSRFSSSPTGMTDGFQRYRQRWRLLTMEGSERMF